MVTYQSLASSFEAVMLVPACARTVIYCAFLWSKEDLSSAFCLKKMTQAA